MLDTKIFGAKLRHHRTVRDMTQEEVAERLGVSSQAVSKWECGECLPDCFNLKALGEVYGISLDILLECGDCDDVKVVAAKIEQLADEFIWAKRSRADNAHRDLGDDLWEMWKGIYFIETGDRQKQQEDKARGSTRVASEYGMKIWDDDGVACVIKSTLRDKLGCVGDRELLLLREMASPEGFRLLTIFEAGRMLEKAELVEHCGIDLHRLNELLLLFSENNIIEFYHDYHCNRNGYKLCAHFGVAVSMMLAIGFILSKQTNYSTSEYITINQP